MFWVRKLPVTKKISYVTVLRDIELHDTVLRDTVLRDTVLRDKALRDSLT